MDAACLAGVSLKIMRLFRCVEIDGVFWLAADMRLQCYTGQWTGYDQLLVFMLRVTHVCSTRSPRRRMVCFIAVLRHALP